MEVVLISGLSGSGKSIALHVLEDAGYYVADNLPATLLPQLIEYLEASACELLAVAVDMRSGACIDNLPSQIARLRQQGHQLSVLFLTARKETLIARFSETRRRHPLASVDVSLAEAIQLERDILAPIAALGHQIDTSDLQSSALRAWVKDLLRLDPTDSLTLMFESFGFKYGIPLDADLVFDVRCLPNPHYQPELRPLTGQDAAVIAYLEAVPEVMSMARDIEQFLHNWLPHYMRDDRSYLTVAIGCTGGQHRSVYLAEQLAACFRAQWQVLVRHRTAGRRERRIS